MPYIGKSPSAGVRQRYQYTATAGQTTFSGTDLGNLTLNYVDNNFVDVFQNGVLLKGGGTDYTATSGTSVVLATGASVSDVIEIIVYDVFSVGNFYNRTDSDSRFVRHDSATAGTDNFIAGNNAGDAIASGGNYNTLVGNEAGTALTTGDNNVAVGFEALSTEDADGGNTAVGYRALKTLNAGAEGGNTAVGKDAGLSLNTGTNNTLVGALAGDALTTGFNNVAIGISALSAEDTGRKNVAVGKGALAVQNSDADNHNTAVGFEAGNSMTTGRFNNIVGSGAGDALTVGNSNIAIGYNALTADTKGDNSVAIGDQALAAQNFTSSTDAYNTAIGSNAGLSVTTGTENTFVGALSGDAITTAAGCTAVGSQALSEAAGSYNTAFGRKALNGVTSSGDRNTAVGEVAGFSINSGARNTCLGVGAGLNLTSGSYNVFVGNEAGITGSPGGNQTTGSGSVIIGDDNISDAYVQVDWTISSDQRDKTDFTALDVGLDFVKQLNPVTYKWDKRSKYVDKTDPTVDLDKVTTDGTHKEDWLDIGFKAQEVEAIEKASGYKIADKTNLTTTLTPDGKNYGIQYTKFVPILVKAIQELSAKNDALEARIKKLEDG